MSLFGELKDHLRLIGAFGKRDALTLSLYKFELLSWLVGMVIAIFNVAFQGLAVQLKIPGILEQEYGEGVSFLAFFVIGYSFSELLNLSMNAPRNSVNPWNLEWLLLSPITLPDVIVGTSWFHYMLGLFQVSTFLVWGAVFGAVFHFDFLSMFVIAVMGLASMWGLGMISAGVQIVTKRWDPINYLFYRLGWLLSGTLFPISLLPSWLQPLSWIIPQTYILEMARQTMLSGKSIFQMGFLPLHLLIYSMVLFTIGVWIFLRCVKVAKKQGTVGFF